MKTTRLFLPLFMCLFFIVSCGYRLASDQPTVMGERSVTLKIKSVEHPTLYPWLTHAVRSSVRDEVNARNIARWVDQGPADYEMQLTVLSFTSRNWMSSEEGVSMLQDNTIVLEATLYKSDTNSVVWKSQRVTFSDRTDSEADNQSQTKTVKQAVRRILDGIQTTF